MAGDPWPAVKAEHEANVGFVEGPGNRNPWSEEIGAGDAAYCVSAATIIPRHHGVTWWDDSQFGVNGFAYCPYLVSAAVRHGVFEFDHTSKGLPAPVYEGDILLWDWNYDGVADHAETAMQDDGGDDGYVHGIEGYNCGTPEGCHAGVTRPRKYLLGVVHMGGWAYTGAAPTAPPAPTPAPAPTPQGLPTSPYTPLSVDGQLGSGTGRAMQWALNQHLFFATFPLPALTEDGQVGPATKRALQWLLGVAQDGQIGPVTVRALQAHVGATVDGSWGPATTKALQRALNAGGF